MATCTRHAATRPAGLTGLALSLAAAAAGANTPAAVPTVTVTIPASAPRPVAPGLTTVTTGVPPATRPVVTPPPAPVNPAAPLPPINTSAAPAAALLDQLVSLDTPVEDCSVTSPYGWRIHPILHRRRFHQGVDFGAAEGTPVHASADGVIEEMDRRGHYGYYLRLRHSGTVQTAYAHLEGFAPGLTVGATVTRGEVIASVGHTGWATGPHLYYEVIVDGRRVDPRRLVLQLPEKARQASAEPLPLTTSGMP